LPAAFALLPLRHQAIARRIRQPPLEGFLRAWCARASIGHSG
jgi:hypothetical protein